MSLSRRLFCCIPAVIVAISVFSASAATLSWWGFEEIASDVIDYSGQAHWGVVRNMPIQADDGTNGFSSDVVGSSILFEGSSAVPNTRSIHLDGINDYVEITNNLATLDLTNNPSSYTLEMFIKLDTVQSNGERTFFMGEANKMWPFAQVDSFFTGYGIPSRPSISTLDNQETNSGQSLYANSRDPSVLSIGHWHHVAFVKDTSNMTIYVDYQADRFTDSDRWDGSLTNIGQAFIGSASLSPTLCFDGYLDEIRFCDVALAPTQFLRVANGLPPIMRNISSSTGSISTLFSSDTSSVYIVESAPPGPTSGPWSYEGTVTGEEFYTSYAPTQTNAVRQYRVQRSLP